MVPLSRFESSDPKRIAVVVNEGGITYGQFNADIACMAGWLRQQGLNPGMRLGIYLGHPYWNWVAHLAALRQGLVFGHVPTRFLEAMLASVPFDVLLGDTQAQGETAPSPRRIVIAPRGLDPLAGQPGLEAVSPVTESLEERAQRVAFTTGTTGKPTAVLWNAEQIARRLDQVRAGAAMDASTRTLSLLGIETTGGFRYPLATWQAGGCVLMIGRIPGGRGISIPAKPASTLLLASPGQLRNLLARVPGEWTGRDRRRVIIAGGRMSIAVRDEALERACARLSMTYGATETGSIATGDAELLERHPGAVGFVRESATVEIVDANGRLQPAGQPGIVRTRTPYMAKGYEGPDTHIAAGGAFRDGWFYPGDEGVLFEDGLLAITGRVSEVINVAGVKVPAPEIETALAGLPGVEDLCALSLRQDEGDRLAIVVVCGDDVDLQALAKQIGPKLPRRMAFRVVRLASIPRNAMGKVPRQALAETLASLLKNPG